MIAISQEKSTKKTAMNAAIEAAPVDKVAGIIARAEYPPVQSSFSVSCAGSDWGWRLLFGGEEVICEEKCVFWDNDSAGLIWSFVRSPHL